MPHPNHEVARTFFAAFFSGEVTDELLTPDFNAWTTLGSLDGPSYLEAGKRVMTLFSGENASFHYTINAVTAEEERAVAEIQAKGVFADGDCYEQTYVFVLKIRDGRVAFIAEHFNPMPALEKLFPRLGVSVAAPS